MKKIYLIRHAKAQKDEITSDFERKLNHTGKEDLKRLFLRLQNYEINPDMIFSSPAKRTAKTAKKLAKFYNFNRGKITYINSLYTANAEQIYDLIKDMSRAFNEIFIVGHNPALKELGELLSTLCLDSFPTSSVLCLEFDINDFTQLKTHSGKLIFFEHIRALKSEKVGNDTQENINQG